MSYCIYFDVFQYQCIKMFKSQIFFVLKYENLFCDTSYSFSLEVLLHVIFFLNLGFFLDRHNLLSGYLKINSKQKIS